MIESKKAFNMRKYGLIGYPLTHSFSPGYFANKFKEAGICDAQYQLYPLERIEEVSEMLDGDIEGLNVTIPYKERVMPYLDEIDKDAQAIGAVNTIKISNGKSIGYNTDIYGFEQSLKEICGEQFPQKALVLGTGGAAKAVQYVLGKLGIEYLKVSRSKGDVRYEQIDSDTIKSHHLIVNTTPLGMYPKLEEYPPIPYFAINKMHILFDLIYNPEKTLFLKFGDREGAKTLNGLKMLELQAEKAWEIWNNNND